MSAKKDHGRGVASLILAGNLLSMGCSSWSTNSYFHKLERRIAHESTANATLSSNDASHNNNTSLQLPDYNLVGSKYAALITGSSALREQYDLSMVYQVLLEIGFKKNNIYILDQNGRKNALYPVDGQASEEEIQRLFSHLKTRVNPKDLLLVYFTGHGKRVVADNQEKNKGSVEHSNAPDLSQVVLSNQTLNETELEQILNRIHSRMTVVLADICYGGGFALRFSKRHYIGISSSLETQQAHGDTEHTFGRHFMNAYRNTPVSDKNGDGVVSLLEAFEFARQNNPWVKDGGDTPLLKSELNVGKLTLQ